MLKRAIIFEYFVYKLIEINNKGSGYICTYKYIYNEYVIYIIYNKYVIEIEY